MYSKRIFAMGIVVSVLASCMVTLYMPTENDAKVWNTTLDSLKAGRELYINKCANCHNLYLPSSHSIKDWKLILNKMQKRAKIENEQKELINKYIETNVGK